MNEITTVGIDLAKHVFSLHGVDSTGRVVLRKTVRRTELEAAVAALPACLIGMEACSGAHEWARRFTIHGHRIKLMAPKFVAPYRSGGKNDANDAAAICEAASRAQVRAIPVKSVEQQAVLCLHRARQGFVEERTAVINRIRGLLAEFGIVLAQRSQSVRTQLEAAVEELPALARQVLRDLRAHLRVIDARIAGYERQIDRLAVKDERCQRLMQLRGIGSITALAIVATVGNASDFKNGRQFAAWLGLVPRQHSTGGKTRLGRITRRGDAYLRTLLVMGARSVLNTAARHNDRMARFANSIQSRRGYFKALVAVAAKHARIVWAMLARNQPLNAAAMR